MLWALLAFIASLSRAGSRISNQYFQLPGLYLVLWIKALIILYLLPVVLFIPWPTSPLFYFFLVMQAPFVVYQDKKTFDLTAQHGGGAITRIEPLSVVLLFFLWFLFAPSVLQNNIENPLRFTSIGLVISLMAYFAMRIKKCRINADILKQMLPLVFITAIVSVLGKLSIDSAEFDNAVFIYVFVQSIVMLICALLFNLKDNTVKSVNFFSKKQFFCSIALSLVMLITVLSRVYAFRFVENPAYVNAIILTAPFWIMLFYKLIKHKEEGDILSGIGIVICAIILTLIVI